MPVMVCVEVDEEFEDARVVMVVAGAEFEDLVLARDDRHAVLVYDESMERVLPGDSIAAEAVSVAAERSWSDVDEWEFGPDALRDPWLYDEGEDEQTTDDVGLDDDYELVDDDDWRPGHGLRD